MEQVDDDLVFTRWTNSILATVSPVALCIGLSDGIRLDRSMTLMSSEH